MRTLWVVMAVGLLSGCGSVQNNSSKTVSFSGQSIGGGTDSKPIECTGTATLTVKWQGSAGTLTVTVTPQGGTSTSQDFAAAASQQTSTSTYPAGKYDVALSRTTNWNGSWDVEMKCP